MSISPNPPRNEPVQLYAPGSPERTRLRETLAAMQAAAPHALRLHIGGEAADGAGPPLEVRAPHRHDLLLGEARQATADDVRRAIDAALAAWPSWSREPFETRATVFLRAADLLSGPWRDRLNAATMLGQSKSVHQAEIDAACELIDFWRWNVHFAERMQQDQPVSPPGVLNRLEYRSLEGFVLAITPFNFTSIGGNLPTAPAILGNVVVWKPASTQLLAAHVIMELLEAAGLPAGVVNLVAGPGAAVSEAALNHPALAGIHFTGSTDTFRHLWTSVSANLDTYRTYPRLIGETGGKDFVLAHESADPEALLVGLVRGAFEYQGQKCSAASRAYVPRSMWHELREPLAAATEALTVGDPAELSTFMGAVIDESSYRKHEEAMVAARGDSRLTLVAGGECDSDVGWFVRPTIYATDDPKHDLMQRELFGPILTVYPYEDSQWDSVLDLVDTTSPYGLTGAVFADDRRAIDAAASRLRHAAGNFYVNDKPTGAVVGQQPFGGGRLSGTNDKAGSFLNLTRWVSARVIKETFVPPTDWRYPHMEAD
ncbi:MAG: L-glutamate gamma-semialdehyde dehydrogenase [Candidatus Dormibacteraeota bacterium]|nr:L-glutamate gamma-semialdehyde dehydrogenase [Candidatus Dormibacteraeota bacterium]MBV9524634.1 L-glutamate gamma-semialdehyde dehydrogenase [Candidatus Dormibacteraeota bacterium]